MQLSVRAVFLALPRDWQQLQSPLCQWHPGAVCSAQLRPQAFPQPAGDLSREKGMVFHCSRVTVVIATVVGAGPAELHTVTADMEWCCSSSDFNTV